ncbi:hypothetical protein FCE95_10545 [Luteimonas gilva]|uniref:Uncharacterized protein n=1 Tax=Luteimonas gilva TaxID=2572684 RepID=A0A4U5JP15_9GAMM|nr:hypothetical protein [Luteimonas gilva]TKR30546.1 hypothetical protein FCE95_10545 [Luteimonas gilva]
MNPIVASLFLFPALASAQVETRTLTSEQVARLELPWAKVCATAVEDPEDISLIALLANPEKYEGKAVRVIGYYRSGFEQSALYLNKSDYENDVWGNGIWIESGGDIPTTAGYLLVSGIFTRSNRGHLGAYQGAICNLSEASPWPGHEH